MEDPVERLPGADALGGVARHLCPIDRGGLRRATREVSQVPRRHRVRDLDDLHVGVRLARAAEELSGNGEDVRSRQRDRFVELRRRGVAQLRRRRELQRQEVGVVVDDEALIVVQRDAAHGQRLHQYRDRLHHLCVGRVRDDEVVRPDSGEDGVGRGQGRVVPVPQRLDLGPLCRGRIVLPLDAGVEGAFGLYSARAVGRRRVHVPVLIGTPRIEPDVEVVPHRHVAPRHDRQRRGRILVGPEGTLPRLIPGPQGA